MYQTRTTNYSRAQYANWPRFRQVISTEVRANRAGIGTLQGENLADGSVLCTRHGPRFNRKPQIGGR